MCDTDFDPAKVFRLETRRARKDHKCCECDLVIPRGSEYVHASGLWESGWESFRRHLECHGLCDIITAVECGGEGEVLFGGLSEELHHLEPGDFDEATGDCAPNWATVAFDAVRAKYATTARAA